MVIEAMIYYREKCGSCSMLRAKSLNIYPRIDYRQHGKSDFLEEFTSSRCTHTLKPCEYDH